MEKLSNRIKDALVITSFQALVIIILGIPIGLGLAQLFGMSTFETVMTGATTGLFIANLFDIQAFGRVSP